MICTVPGCSRLRSQKRLMCGSHDYRRRKYGDPLAGETRKGELTDFILRHADYAGDDCLRWPYGSKGNGYGDLRFRGHKTTASRAMCIQAHGEPTPGCDAAHSCGNGHLGCVNPKHLRWASRLENVHDAMRDGTASKGRLHSDAIKRAWAEASRADRIRAKRLGVPVETLTAEARSAA